MRASTDPSFPEHAFDEATAAALDLDAGRGRLTHADATVRLGSTEPGPFRDPPPPAPAVAAVAAVASPEASAAALVSAHLVTTSVVVDRAGASSLWRTIALGGAVIALLAGVGAGAYAWAASSDSAGSAGSSASWWPSWLSSSSSSSSSPSAAVAAAAAAPSPGPPPLALVARTTRVALAAKPALPRRAEPAPAALPTAPPIAVADDAPRAAPASRRERAPSPNAPNADLLTGY